MPLSFNILLRRLFMYEYEMISACTSHIFFPGHLFCSLFAVAFVPCVNDVW